MHVTVYHQAPEERVKAILRDGLQYGAQGPGNKEGYASKTNDLLDQLRPDAFRQANISRNQGLYAYYAADGKLCDIYTGAFILPSAWQPGDGLVGFSLDIDPAIAWVSDLDAYDRLAAIIDHPATAASHEALAREYWQRLLPMATVLEHYHYDGTALVQKETAPGNLPRRFQRVEVLLTASIPASAIRALA